MGIKMLINGVTLEKANLTPLVHEIKYFQKQHYQITLVGTTDLKKRLGKSINFIKIKKYRSINSRLDLIWIGLRRNLNLIRHIKKFCNKYQIVYSRSSVLDLIIFPFFLKHSNPKIKWATVFDNIVPITDSGNKISRFIAWIFFQISLALIRRADLIFVISPELRQFLINRHFNKNKLILTGNGVETDLIKKIKKTKCLYDGLFIGRINETKGIFDMLKVISQIKKEIPNFKLAIIGDGYLYTKNKFKNKIKSLKLSKNIILLGTKNNLEKFSIIKSSKIFIFLSKSKSESFGIALLEAVSCGLPAFTYDLPTYKNIYQNNEINSFKIGDYQSIAKAIIKTFRNNNFSNPQGQKLLGKYNWQNIAKTETYAITKLIHTG